MSAEVWQALTRLGESGVVLPIALITAFGLGAVCRRAQAVFACMLPLAVALSVAVFSKIAFIGFGWGSAVLDFTGVSGHALLAAAVYPVLAHAFFGGAARPWHMWAAVAALLLLVVVAVSRVVVGAHSLSESVAGAALGGVAAVVTIRALSRIPSRSLPVVWMAPMLIWLVATLASPPLLASQDMVERLALKLADRTAPFVRAELHQPTTTGLR